MKFSTRAEYGLKAAVALGRIYPNTKSIKELSQEEDIPFKYLERLMSVLKQEMIVKSYKGKEGGYALSQKPARITAGKVIEALEGPIAPMQCSDGDCTRGHICSSSSVWIELGKAIKKTLYSIKLSDIT